MHSEGGGGNYSKKADGALDFPPLKEKSTSPPWPYDQRNASQEEKIADCEEASIKEEKYAHDSEQESKACQKDANLLCIADI